MDPALHDEMMRYYEERAREHDEVYLGRGPAIPEHAADYVRDVALVEAFAADFGEGELVDLACGTGYWAPHYARNTEHITFVDQSPAVLDECRARVAGLGLPRPPRFVRGDVFAVELPRGGFDSAVCGFLLSHLDDEQLAACCARLRELLRPGASVLVIDSLWSERRHGHVNRAGVQQRRLEDGRAFRIYKRYFAPGELPALLAAHGFRPARTLTGRMMLALSARAPG